MLIISKYRDYYDSAVGVSGVDKQIVYERKPSVFKSDYYNKLHIRESWYDYLSNIINKGYNESRELGVLGFCGKLYVVLIDSKYQPIEKGGTVTNILYGPEIVPYLYKTDKKNKYSSRYYRPSKSNKEKLEDIINEYHGKSDSSSFIKHNVPIFFDHVIGDKFLMEDNELTGKDGGLLVNPSLEKYGFYKIKDSFSAFQDIQNYISGVLGVNTKPIVVIDDKYKIQQHGFDPKWSFRNPDPPKRKQKK